VTLKLPLAAVVADRSTDEALADTVFPAVAVDDLTTPAASDDVMATAPSAIGEPAIVGVKVTVPLGCAVADAMSPRNVPSTGDGTEYDGVMDVICCVNTNDSQTSRAPSVARLSGVMTTCPPEFTSAGAASSMTCGVWLSTDETGTC
jgi:hypothetical protein